MTLNPNKDLDFSYLTPAYIRREMERDRAHDRLHTLRLTAAKERGVSALVCESCAARHSLYLIGERCNAAHPDVDGDVCGGPLAEVLA